MPWLGAQQSAILERIIVKVNGEILTQTQLEDLQIEVLRDQNKQVENRKALSTNEEVRKALLEITPALLVEEVDKLLMLQRARELNLKYSDEMFKQNIDNIKKQNADTIKTDADLERALKEAGLTMVQAAAEFRKGLLCLRSRAAGGRAEHYAHGRGSAAVLQGPSDRSS